jgi:hypothetical protein
MSRPQRVLVYGMQSSGSSLVTLFLAQQPETVGIIDLYCGRLMPSAASLGDATVVAKATVSTVYGLDQHLERFKPDRKLLVLRHPGHNYAALIRKQYANLCGNIDDKFALLEQVFARRGEFDAVVYYEDFVLRRRETLELLRRAGLAVDASYYRFARTREQIATHGKSFRWFAEGIGTRWGFGNIHGDGVENAVVFKRVSAAVSEHVRAICPQAYQDSEQHLQRRFGTLRIAGSAILNDVMMRNPRDAWRWCKRAVRRLATGRTRS